MTLSKEDFIVAVWNKINNVHCDALDAVQEIAEQYNIDMETAGKLVGSNTALKKLIEMQAHHMNQLKKPPASLD